MAQTQFRLQSFSPGSITAESRIRAVQASSILMAPRVLLPDFALVCLTALPTAFQVF
jgi:hypothetical protein